MLSWLQGQPPGTGLPAEVLLLDQHHAKTSPCFLPGQGAECCLCCLPLLFYFLKKKKEKCGKCPIHSYPQYGGMIQISLQKWFLALILLNLALK